MLQVQRDQQDAQQFWLALMGAVRGAGVGTGGAEPPAATLDFDGPTMVDRVLSELADRGPALPTNLSRPEIAAELSVSVNTVNTHVRNIHAKLSARDRSSAVQRARELRLLSAGTAVIRCW
jgi:hypothetical protein